MGAPVARVGLVHIPAELIREEKALAHLSPGVAHGSLWIEDLHESRAFESVSLPQNRLRFADLAILYGWCEAFDHQFLYRNSPPPLVYSADHGHFFPEGPDWGGKLYRAESVTPDPQILGAVHVAADDLRTACAKLNGIDNADIAAAVAAPPDSWGVPMSDRVAMASYLSTRRVRMLRALFPSLEAGRNP